MAFFVVQGQGGRIHIGLHKRTSQGHRCAFEKTLEKMIASRSPHRFKTPSAEATKRRVSPTTAALTSCNEPRNPSPFPRVQVRFAVCVVVAIGYNGAGRLVHAVHRLRRIRPLGLLRRQLEGCERFEVRLALVHTIVAKRVLGAQREPQLAQPRVIAARSSHPLRAGVIDVRFFVGRRETLVERIQNVPRSAQ